MELFSNVVIERDFPDHEIKSILDRSEQATGHQQFIHQSQDYHQNTSSMAETDPSLDSHDQSSFWSQDSPSNSSSTSPSSQT
ncbi:hypothetical protein FPOAC2_03627 [Fusarium poae]